MWISSRLFKWLDLDTCNHIASNWMCVHCPLSFSIFTRYHQIFAGITELLAPYLSSWPTISLLLTTCLIEQFHAKNLIFNICWNCKTTKVRWEGDNVGGALVVTLWIIFCMTVNSSAYYHKIRSGFWACLHQIKLPACNASEFHIPQTIHLHCAQRYTC